jgi:hypothetical protein
MAVRPGAARASEGPPSTARGAARGCQAAVAAPRVSCLSAYWVRPVPAQASRDPLGALCPRFIPFPHARLPPPPPRPHAAAQKDGSDGPALGPGQLCVACVAAQLRGMASADSAEGLRAEALAQIAQACAAGRARLGMPRLWTKRTFAHTCTRTNAPYPKHRTRHGRLRTRNPAVPHQHLPSIHPCFLAHSPTPSNQPINPPNPPNPPTHPPHPTPPSSPPPPGGGAGPGGRAGGRGRLLGLQDLADGWVGQSR